MNIRNLRSAVLLSAILTLCFLLCLASVSSVGLTAAIEPVDNPFDQEEPSAAEQPLAPQDFSDSETTVTALATSDSLGVITPAEVNKHSEATVFVVPAGESIAELIIEIDAMQTGLIGIEEKGVELILSSSIPYTADSVIEIRELIDFISVRDNLGGTFRLVSDIGMDSSVSWAPIGDEVDKFTGTFDGQGYTISDLFIESVSSDLGLFGYVNGATLENIKLDNVDINGGSNVGGLVGRADNSEIINCSVEGNVDGNGINVGGLVGYAYTSTISNSSAEVAVHGQDSSVGGLIGHAHKTPITNCSATGSVQGEVSRVGGLAGYAQEISITSSFAECTVTGSGILGGVGGLVGLVSPNSTITDSYAAGTISGSTDAGGLVGYVSKYSSINNCYSAAIVKGSDANIGGLVGSSHSLATCTESYWDTLVSEQVSSALGSGKETNQMKQQLSYSGWNFEDIWFIEEGVAYPVLQWQLVGSDPDPDPPIDQPDPELPAEKPGLPVIPAQHYHFIPDHTPLVSLNFSGSPLTIIYRYLAEVEMFLAAMQAGEEAVSVENLAAARAIYTRAQLLFASNQGLFSETESAVIIERLAAILQAIIFLELRI